MTGEFQTSAPYLAAVLRGLRTRGHDAEVMRRAGPALDDFFRAPSAHPWWGPEVVRPFFDAVFETGGGELMREVGRFAVYDSISAIVRPLVAVLTVISGATPTTFFSRYPQLTQAALNHVGFQWKATSETSGVLTVSYPCPVRREFAHLWEGCFDFTFETARREGELVSTRHDGEGRFAFELRWKAA